MIFIFSLKKTYKILIKLQKKKKKKKDKKFMNLILKIKSKKANNYSEMKLILT